MVYTFTDLKRGDAIRLLTSTSNIHYDGHVAHFVKGNTGRVVDVLSVSNRKLVVVTFDARYPGEAFMFAAEMFMRVEEGEMDE